MDELKPIIRSLAISSAGGLTLQQLERDFKSLEGYSIPYQRLGFSSLASLLQTLTDVVRIKGNDQQRTIHPVTTEKNEHILALVEKSKKSKKKHTVVREPLPQKPKSGSKPCIEVQKYTAKPKQTQSPSKGHSSRNNGSVPPKSSSLPPFSSGNESDYHFDQFMRWLYDVLQDNVNSIGQPTNNRNKNKAQAQNNPNSNQNRQQQRPPSAQSSGRNYNSVGWNYNSAGWNNGAGWYNNSTGWNNNSSGWNNNSSGWNNNSSGWNNNYPGCNNSSGWNNNFSAGWNNNFAGFNPNFMTQWQGNTNNYAFNGNTWNGNYPSNTNYGNNGPYYNGNGPQAVAPGYQNQCGPYAMNYPQNYGYNNYSANGFNNAGQNSNNMPNSWYSYGQYLPNYYY